MPLCLILQWSCLDSSQSASSLSGFVPDYWIDPELLTVRQKFHLCVWSSEKVARAEAWCSLDSQRRVQLSSTAGAGQMDWCSPGLPCCKNVGPLVCALLMWLQAFTLGKLGVKHWDSVLCTFIAYGLFICRINYLFLFFLLEWISVFFDSLLLRREKKDAPLKAKKCL